MAPPTVVHSHDHASGGAHDHTHEMTRARLRTAFLLTAIILLVEVVGGLLSNSLALLADAGHVLTDILALGLAWFAAARAEQPADARNTYGQHRIGILAALANAVTLILIVIWISWEAIQRLRQPETVTPWIMFTAAVVGIAVNVYIVLSLRAHGGENLNVRGAMLHALGDIGASVGVIVGALVILLTGWQYADPIISLGIAALVAKSAWDLLSEAIDILMESSPRDLDVAQLARDVTQVSGVSDVHDLHVWSIAGGMRVLTAHVQVDDDRRLSGCDDLVNQIHCLVCERYRISHTTIQVEQAGCAHSDLYCCLPDTEHHRSHDHLHETDELAAHGDRISRSDAVTHTGEALHPTSET
jgi:cobalt-zinc-cadmium efflux system protein